MALSVFRSVWRYRVIVERQAWVGFELNRLGGLMAMATSVLPPEDRKTGVIILSWSSFVRTRHGEYKAYISMPGTQ